MIASYTVDDILDVGRGNDVINGNGVARWNILVMVYSWEDAFFEQTIKEQTVVLQNLDASTAQLVVNGTSYEFDRSTFTGQWDLSFDPYFDIGGSVWVELSNLTGRVHLTAEGPDLLHARFDPYTVDAPDACERLDDSLAPCNGFLFYADAWPTYTGVRLSNLTEPVLLEVSADSVSQIVYIRQVSLEPENAGKEPVADGLSYEDLGKFFVQISAANDLVLDQSSGSSGDFTDQSDNDDSLGATFGGDEEDTFWAGYGDNSLLGQNGDDTLLEVLGDDLLDSGLGKNYLDGGLG